MGGNRAGKVGNHNNSDNNNQEVYTLLLQYDPRDAASLMCTDIREGIFCFPSPSHSPPLRGGAWMEERQRREGGPRLACIVGPDSFGKTGVGKKGKGRVRQR